MARTHMQRLLFVQIFCVARLQSFPGGLQHAAHQSPAPQAKLPLHALDPSAGIHRLHCAVDTLPPSPHECPSMFPPVPPSLLPPFLSRSRGTKTELTSHRYDKSFTKGRALFSALGSTPVMARTHMQRLLFVQSGQAAIPNEMKSIRSTLLQHEQKFEEITKRLSKIEDNCSVIVTVKEIVDGLQAPTEQNSGDTASLVARMDDSEDRQRRCNLVFYGFEDASDETWAQSEKRVMDLCLANLEVSVQPEDIERAHRIGCFQPSKNRPIMSGSAISRIEN
ncbi:hypothetical protein HPB51_015709 [Rhipicephalus microplus]|uniref:Uncharacterized protein n=1 Tax=Rhipicephalus microplus TaxID=6941 RepID=A0A9J6D5R8_RHIMP|nr:hypothetical protein HPB51_015709 [Rhipicephalus microplus]